VGGVAPLTLGNWSIAGYGLGGMLDAVSFHQRALLDAEVDALYNGGAGDEIPWGCRYLLSNPTNDKAIILTPATMSGDINLIEFVHASGGDPDNIYTKLQWAATKALLDAGFIVVATMGLNYDNWARTEARTALRTLYDLVSEFFVINAVGMLGASMGGIASLLALTDGSIPNSNAWLGAYPCCILSVVYNNTGGGFDGPPHIDPQYGITGVSPHTYAEATAGHDPFEVPASKYNGKGMMFVASPDDTTIEMSAQTTPMAAYVNGHAAEATVLTASGPHGSQPH
jgi:hypothetical protein